MGVFNKLADIIRIKKEKITILVIGLNNSGKSTIINCLKNSEEQTAITVPTVGFTVEQFQSQGVSFTAIDMSGGGRYRSLWEHHLANCHGIVYVIDSSDKMRLVVVRDELEILLKHPDMEKRQVPVLFYGNKIDCDDALSSVKLAAAVELEKIKNHPWQITSSNALTGEGIDEGVQWLIEQARMSFWHKNGH